MTAPDIVYLVGDTGTHHDELRYSLRSVAVNMPHTQVWIIGHKPEWVRNVQWVPTAQVSSNKYVNTLRNWNAALHHPGIADNFVLFNDDFYCMTPGKPATPMHRGTISGMLSALKYKTTRNGDYLHQINTCREYLIGRGLDEPLSYELHIPMPFHKPTAADILTTLPHEPTTYGYVKRSIYGNLANIGGNQMQDVRPLRHGYWTWDWLSSNDDSFKPGLRTRLYLEHRFPKPCPYEDPATAPHTRTTALICTNPERDGGRIKLFKAGDPRIPDLISTGTWQPV